MSRNAPPTMATKEVRFRKQMFDSDCGLRSDGNCWKPSRSGRTAGFDVKRNSCRQRSKATTWIYCRNKNTQLKQWKAILAPCIISLYFWVVSPMQTGDLFNKLPKCLKESSFLSTSKGNVQVSRTNQTRVGPTVSCWKSQIAWQIWKKVLSEIHEMRISKQMENSTVNNY